MDDVHRFDRHLGHANGNINSQKRILGNLLQGEALAIANDWKQELERFLPTKRDLEAMPDGSWLLKLPFALAKPFTSKTENEFHPYQERQDGQGKDWFELQNPIIRDHLTGLPLVKPTTWKGHLCFAARMAGIPEPMIHRLFGQSLGDESGKAGRLHFFPTFFMGNVEREVVTPLQRATRTPVPRRGPIDLEVVPAGSTGTFYLLYLPYPKGKDSSRKQVAQDLETVAAALKAMLLEYGFSAKKTAGWGVIEDAMTDGYLWARGLMWPPLAEDTVRGGAPSFQEPRSEYLALMDESGEAVAGLRKPDGAWLSNREFNALPEKPASLNVYRQFRNWYDTHGERWRRKLAGTVSGPTETVRTYQITSVTSLYDLANRLSKAL